MMDKVLFPRWSKTECAECGCEFQVTRTEPREKLLSECICEACEAYNRGVSDCAARIAELEAQLKDCGDKLLEAQSDALNTTLEVDRLKAQLKTAKRDALQKLADGLEIPPTKEGPFVWGHLHSQIMNEIESLYTIGKE